MALDTTRDWKILLAALPDDYEQLAVEHKLLNLQWKNAKIRSASDLLRLFFMHAGADLPLRQTVAMIGEAGGPQISAVRLHLKMRSAAPYLGTLIARMCASSRAHEPERWGGYELVVIDGSTVSGPGADGIDARLHTVIRVSDLRPLNVKVTSVSQGETFKRFVWEPGQLAIGDRGYSNAPGIAAVVDGGADVLVRVNRGALPLYDEETSAIDVLAWLRSLEGHRAHERRAQIRIWDENRHLRTIDGRLIGFRLPEREAAEARQRVLDEHGVATTEEMFEAANYVALFSTAPPTRLSAARAVEAYRLRWQIELQFKRWKSLCRFDKLPNYRDDTIRAWLSVKVLLGLILDRIGSAGAGLSPPEHNQQQARRRTPNRKTAMEDHRDPLAGDSRRDLAHRVA